MARPLKAVTSGSNINVQEMSDSDINGYMGPIILAYIVNNPSITYGTTLRVNSAGTYDVPRGNVADTRTPSIGSHPASQSTISTYTFYQNERVISPLGVTARPVHYVANGSENRIIEMTDAEIYTWVAPAITQTMITGGQGAYYLGLTSSGPPVTGTWVSYATLYDSYYNASNVLTSDSYTLWQRTTGTTTGAVRPLKLNGSAGLIDMTDAEIQSLAVCVGEYIRNTSVGQYAFQPSAPVTGTWLNRGSFTNTINNLVDTGYAAAYAGTYAGSFTGTFAGTYGGTYTTAYNRIYTGIYTRIRNQAYVGYYAQAYTGAFVGSYTQNYAGTYSRAYTMNYSGNFTNIGYTTYVPIAVTYPTYTSTAGLNSYTHNSSGISGYYTGSVTYIGYLAITQTFTPGVGSSALFYTSTGYYPLYYTGTVSYAQLAYYAINYTDSIGYTSRREQGILLTYTGNFVGYFATNYTSSYVGYYATTYLGSYLGAFTTTYAGSYTSSYVGNYTGTYTSPIFPSFTSSFTGSYSGSFIGYFTGSYSNMFTGQTVQTSTSTTTYTLWVRTA